MNIYFAAVDLVRRVATETTGTRWQITAMMDAEGDETDNPGDVVAVVCSLAGDGIHATLVIRSIVPKVWH